MTEHGAGAGEPASGKRKRKKERGRIRQRTWRDANGDTRTAWQADFGQVNGKRLMRSFQTKADAVNWLHERNLLLGSQGHAAFSLTDAQRMDAEKAREALAGIPALPKNALLETTALTFKKCWESLRETGGTVRDAVDFFVKHHPPAGLRRTVAETAEGYVQDGIEHGLRPDSIKDIQGKIRGFVAVHGARQVSEITGKDGDQWISGMTHLSPRSKKHYRTILHGLFQFATDEGCYTAENPFATKRQRRKYHEDEVLPECMPWRDVQKVMLAAVDHAPLMVPALAIGFFAGLRPAELRQLDWRDVDIEARRITVLPAVAKKRRARHVHIEENLAAWLLPYRQPSGMIAPQGARWWCRLQTVRKNAGVKWIKNTMRHSYASHHLVKYGEAAKTAFQLGHHRDTSMLFEHYRALVKPEDGKEYFDIRPAEAGRVLAFKATA